MKKAEEKNIEEKYLSKFWNHLWLIWFLTNNKECNVNNQIKISTPLNLKVKKRENKEYGAPKSNIIGFIKLR